MTLERSLAPELLDEADQDPKELAESLEMVAAVNRWLGGLASVQRHLDPWRGRACSILDVGTGNGDTAAGLLRSVGSTEWKMTGVDLRPLTTLIARDRHPALALAVADGLHLPFADEAFDVSVSFLTLHHFEEDVAADVVAEMARVTRDTVLVSDLERHRVNYWGARLLATTLWRKNRLTRSDGPLSVLKAFRPQELLRIGKAARLRNARVDRRFFYRLVLSGGPGHRGGSA